MDKRILKRIAKEWCKGMLYANNLSSFDDELDALLSVEEQQYIVDETKKLADRITKEDYSTSLAQLVKKYYEFE